MFYDIFFFQAEDGIRDLVRSRGLGDVYKRQGVVRGTGADRLRRIEVVVSGDSGRGEHHHQAVDALSLIHI